MARRTKPKVLINCVANAHTGVDERIIEFSFPAAQDGRGGLPGGLIAFRQSNNLCSVDVYRTEGCTVQAESGIRTHPAPAQVYVLSGESNGSENGESDGWVISVHGTREGAEAAQAVAVAEAIAAGHRVIGHETAADEDEDEWDRSFAITSYQVRA
jgi:hypothetical protein